MFNQIVVLTELSTWAGPISYSTCPGGAPYLETFDANPASQALTNATGPCWTQSTNDVFDWLINNGPTSSANYWSFRRYHWRWELYVHRNFCSSSS